MVAEKSPSASSPKDRTVLIASAIIVVGFCLLGAVFPQGTSDVVYAINSFLTHEVGWLYLVMVAFFCAFGMFMAFSRYGNIRLGKDDDRPEYSNFQWFALLFGGGIGIGLVFWGVAEPMYHIQSNPLNAAGEVEIARNAVRIAFMHEGVHCWALFAVCGMSLGYFAYRKDMPFLMSSAFYPLLGDRIYGSIGKAIDIVAVFATIFGITTSLGLAALQITGGLNYIYDLGVNPFMTCVIIGIITALFTLATVAGLEKMMAKVVNAKVYLSIAFLVFFLVFAGFLYIMQTMTEVFGTYVSTFVQQSFWMGDPEWLSSWTIFYWGWWIAWATFCGQFFARVSKGRTVREILLAGTLLPAGFSFIWMVIYGAAGINMNEMAGGAITNAVNNDYTTALYALLQNLPLYQVTAPLALVLVVLCFVGAADSATFVLPMLTLGGDMNPSKKSRAFWGIAEGTLTIVMFIVGGETVLKVLQTASVASAFPFMFVLLGMCIGAYKAMRAEFGKGEDGAFATQAPARAAGGQQA